MSELLQLLNSCNYKKLSECETLIINLMHCLMKKTMLFLALAALLLTGCKQEVKEVVALPRTTATPEVTAAVDSFVLATQTRPVKPDSISLHSIMILKNGEVVS